jgi:sarcosine oxidase
MLNFEILDAAQIRKRFSQFRPSDDEVALYEAKAGYLRPEECILQHLAEASKRGAQLHFEEPILSWKATSSGDGVTVTSAKKTYHARSLILATGAWSPQILAQLGLPIAAFRRVMFWFDPTSGTDAFSPRNCPVYLWETEGGELFYGFPTDGGEDRGVKVAIHGGDEACTPDSIDREIRPSDELAIRSIIASRIPFLTGRLIDARTCMYTMTPDEHFIIEPHREFPQVSIAAGFSGHGFKFASVVGEILADLATEGKTNHNIDQFSSRRFDSAVPW